MQLVARGSDKAKTQLVARDSDKAKVIGSSPVESKKLFTFLSIPFLHSFLILFLPVQGGGGLEGPVLKCRDSTQNKRVLYLNELVIHEIRNNTSAIFRTP